MSLSSSISTLLALAPACGSLVGCVQVTLSRDTQLEPLSETQLASLTPGDATLQSALDVLGPPLLAWELPQQGAALAWGWSRTGGWGVMVSAPIGDQGGSLSLDYVRSGADLLGAALFFDSNWQLTALRQGRLRELFDSSRARPEFDEEEAANNAAPKAP